MQRENVWAGHRRRAERGGYGGPARRALVSAYVTAWTGVVDSVRHRNRNHPPILRSPQPRARSIQLLGLWLAQCVRLPTRGYTGLRAVRGLAIARPWFASAGLLQVPGERRPTHARGSAHV
eukprot:356058-Chlamydomonas_euryale.AAC.11